MSPLVMVVVALVIMVATVAVGTRVRTCRNELATLSPEDRSRHEAIVAADRALALAQETFDTAVTQASARVAGARRPRALATTADAAVTETSVILPGAVRPLVPGITARVDVIGDRSHSRAAAESILLTVTGPRWQEVLTLPVSQDVQATRFAEALNVLSPQAPVLLHRYRTRVAEAEQAHWIAVSDTARLDAARRARSVLELDPLDEVRRVRQESRRRTFHLTQPVD